MTNAVPDAAAQPLAFSASRSRPAYCGAHCCSRPCIGRAKEMAIAANIPAPRVRFIDGSLNGAAFGIDIGDATVLIGDGLAATLTRSQMQGVAAHLVASIADGDMAIGLRTACTVGVYSLVHRLGLDVLTSMQKAEALRSACRLLRALMLPSAAA